MADVTVTVDTKFNTSPSLASGRLLVVGGEAGFTTYATGGVDMTVPGINNVVACFIESTAGFVFHYTPSSESVLAYKQSGASGALALVADAATITATAPFIAFGF